MLNDKMESNLVVSKPNKFDSRFIMISIISSMIAGGLFGGPPVIALYVLKAIPDADSSILKILHVGLAANLFLISFAVIWYFPVFFGSRSVRKLVNDLCEEKSVEGGGYICQIKFTPRLYGGLRGLVDDADDVGFLRFIGGDLEFIGDHVHIYLEGQAIESIKHVNADALYGGGILGGRVSVHTSVFDGYKEIVFSGRDSNTIKSSRQNALRMMRDFEEFIKRKV